MSNKGDAEGNKNRGSEDSGTDSILKEEREVRKSAAQSEKCRLDLSSPVSLEEETRGTSDPFETPQEVSVSEKHVPPLNPPSHQAQPAVVAQPLQEIWARHSEAEQTEGSEY